MSATARPDDPRGDTERGDTERVDTERVDVVIVGAGLSGIGAACRLASEHPHRRVVVLEARETSGGTWDLFRYPGIRSDSDMFTLGYRFRPWTGDRALADGPSILGYLRDTAREYGVAERIRFGHRATEVSWDSARARWTVSARRADGTTARFDAGFVWACTGYYDYAGGYEPHFEGTDRFRGTIVHPQDWPDDLAYAGRRVVVIGSGATAVTLVPALAETAGHVTMLQRSPTYIVSLPARDLVATGLRRVLPGRVAYFLIRWKNIAVSAGLYQVARRWPWLVRWLIRGWTRRQLPAGYDVDTHFRPGYDPWDQRLCVVPDGDLFRAISEGRASVVTDAIDTFTETGIRLASGAELPADIVVTATGLRLLPFGGCRVVVDGTERPPGSTMAYRTMMLADIPNFAFTIGYTNASWTLKADLVAEYVCRLLRYLDRHGYRSVTPQRPPGLAELPLLDLSAGYVRRSVSQLPRQGDREPWRLRQNYPADSRAFKKAVFDDGSLRFR